MLENRVNPDLVQGDAGEERRASDRGGGREAAGHDAVDQAAGDGRQEPQLIRRASIFERVPLLRAPVGATLPSAAKMPQGECRNERQFVQCALAGAIALGLSVGPGGGAGFHHQFVRIPGRRLAAAEERRQQPEEPELRRPERVSAARLDQRPGEGDHPRAAHVRSGRPRRQGVSHWVAYGIPVSVTGFAEGEVSKPSEKFVGGTRHQRRRASISVPARRPARCTTTPSR